MKPAKPKSALEFVLKSLIPYSHENLMLTFKPAQFFNELEKISKYKRKTLEAATRRARERGLIEQSHDLQLRLTALGRRTALPYTAQRLPRNARLMVIFDVPEDRATARQQFRRLLRKWQFEQIQKSVWESNYDHRESIKLAIEELGLDGCVELHESLLLYPLK